MDNVQLIQLVNEIIPIPRAPNHVIGVANIENSVIPIIDLEVLLTIREREISKNGIVVIVSLANTIFGLYMFSLPRVISRDEIKESSDFTNVLPIPDDWITGYVNLTEKVEKEIQEEEGEVVTDEWIPRISPEKFWISLGDTQIIGPAIRKLEIKREERRKQEEERKRQEEEQKRLEEEKRKAEEEEEEIESQQVSPDEVEEYVSDIEEDIEDAEVVDDSEIEEEIFDEENVPDGGSDKEDISPDDEDLSFLENVDGLSSSTVETLNEAGYSDKETLNSISLDDLTKIKGIGKKTAERIISALEE